MLEYTTLTFEGNTLTNYEPLWQQAGRGANFSGYERQALRVLQCASGAEAPLYTASIRQYSPDRHYNFCGPYQRQLAQIAQEDAGAELSQDDPYTPHLQLHIHRLGETDDQTSLVYYVGDGTAIILDGVIRLVKAGRQPGRNAIHANWVPVSDLSQEFTMMGLTLLHDTSTYGGEPIVDQKQLYPHTDPFPYDEMERIMHTDEVYADFVTLSNGKQIDVRSFWGPRMRAVYAETRRIMNDRRLVAC